MYKRAFIRLGAPDSHRPGYHRKPKPQAYRSSFSTSWPSLFHPMRQRRLKSIIKTIVSKLSFFSHVTESDQNLFCDIIILVAINFTFSLNLIGKLDPRKPPLLRNASCALAHYRKFASRGFVLGFLYE